ncbi:MAG: hypothetical protein EA412_03040 [Chitinophagaceae bacterium]|nr:MAG: hypothetical protein EA412_03040 [Chitinophagaceae bacterium]
MKIRKFFAILLLLLVIPVSEIFSIVISRTNWPREAHKIVYVTQWKSEADLIVYVTNDRKASDQHPGIWYYTDSAFDADWVIFVTKTKSRADLIIYVTKDINEAGWQSAGID